jgi:hypothetical protein
MLTNLEIKRIDLWSLFKLAFIINGVIGLIIGFFYALMIMAIGGINSAVFADEFSKIGVFGGVLGLVMIPFFAFINAIFGSVVTTVCGWIYNAVAGVAGGLRIQASEVVETVVVSQSPVAQRRSGGSPGSASGGENSDRTVPRGTVSGEDAGGAAPGSTGTGIAPPDKANTD